MTEDEIQAEIDAVRAVADTNTIVSGLLWTGGTTRATRGKWWSVPEHPFAMALGVPSALKQVIGL